MSLTLANISKICFTTSHQNPVGTLKIMKNFIIKNLTLYKKFGPYVLSGGPLIFNVILFKRKAVYTEGAGPVCKCTGQCTLEGCILLF